MFAFGLAGVKVLYVGLEALKHFNLHEILKTLGVLLLGLQLHVCLFGDEQVVLGKLLLIIVKFFFKHRDLSFRVQITQLLQRLLMFLLELSLLEVEVLFLGFNDDCKLGFFPFGLLNQFLELGNLLEVLDLLRCDLPVQQILLLLTAHLLHQVVRLHVAIRRSVALTQLHSLGHEGQIAFQRKQVAFAASA